MVCSPSSFMHFYPVRRTVREMSSILAPATAHDVFIINSGTVTEDAIRSAKGKPINLVDGDEFLAMIARVRRGERDGLHEIHADDGGPEMFDAEARKSEPDGSRVVPCGLPDCPRCEGKLVVKTVRKGKYAAYRFLDCETFPNVVS